MSASDACNSDLNPPNSYAGSPNSGGGEGEGWGGGGGRGRGGRGRGGQGGGYAACGNLHLAYFRMLLRSNRSIRKTLNP